MCLYLGASPSSNYQHAILRWGWQRDEDGIWLVLRRLYSLEIMIEFWCHPFPFKISCKLRRWSVACIGVKFEIVFPAAPLGHNSWQILRRSLIREQRLRHQLADWRLGTGHQPLQWYKWDDSKYHTNLLFNKKQKKSFTVVSIEIFLETMKMSNVIKILLRKVAMTLRIVPHLSPTSSQFPEVHSFL